MEFIDEIKGDEKETKEDKMTRVWKVGLKCEKLIF